jgi:ABC-type nitrate/sulfonate/bicarbonate transport system permease component
VGRHRALAEQRPAAADLPADGAGLPRWSQDGELFGKTWLSLQVLLKAYLLGIVAAFVLTTLAVSTQFGRDLLGTLTSMFNPLPAIALLPSPCCGSGWAKAA